jgi:hypothetical protein
VLIPSSLGGLAHARNSHRHARLEEPAKQLGVPLPRSAPFEHALSLISQDREQLRIRMERGAREERAREFDPGELLLEAS